MLSRAVANHTQNPDIIGNLSRILSYRFDLQCKARALFLSELHFQ